MDLRRESFETGRHTRRGGGCEGCEGCEGCPLVRTRAARGGFGPLLPGPHLGVVRGLPDIVADGELERLPLVILLRRDDTGRVQQLEFLPQLQHQGMLTSTAGTLSSSRTRQTSRSETCPHADCPRLAYSLQPTASGPPKAAPHRETRCQCPSTRCPLKDSRSTHLQTTDGSSSGFATTIPVLSAP